jgi:hypothetical protein
VREYVALHLQLPVLAAQLREFLTLGGGQPVVTHTRIATGLCYPVVVVCAVGSNSFSSSSGLRPALTSSTICARNSAGYGVRCLPISAPPFQKNRRPFLRVNFKVQGFTQGTAPPYWTAELHWGPFLDNKNNTSSHWFENCDLSAISLEQLPEKLPEKLLNLDLGGGERR